VQGASDLLGQELPAVEWDPAPGGPEDGADDLVHRVEQVVQKLHQRERDVRRAERLAALGQLAAGVAHEVRNPLAAVILLVETGRRDPTAGGLTDEDLDLIEQELHRIERSLRGLLDYARPPRPEPTACDLADVVRDAAALTRARADQQLVTVRLDLPPEPVPLHADAEQLRQVVLNLLLNALDVMPNGSEVSVAVAQPDSRCVELTIADGGPGISAQVLPRLFEPFVSGKDTGLGLGLVVSKRIVEDHGGTIRGENPPGGGATFVVRLPAASGGPRPSLAVSPNGVPACQPCS
jgi:signal transduction histidine kinase